MMRDEEEPLLINEPCELTPEILDQIRKLRQLYNDIIRNMSNDAQQYFANLEAYYVRLIDQAGNVNAESGENKRMLLAIWRDFIKNFFLKELQQQDIISKNLDSDTQLINDRFKQFIFIFHPDKNIKEELFTKEISNDVTVKLSSYRNAIIFNTASANKELDFGEELLKKYQIYKNSPLVELRNEAKTQVILAITRFKKVIKALENEEWRSYLPDNSYLEVQIKAREKIADCYAILNQYFHAQLYIVGALRIAERSFLFDNKRERLFQLRDKLQKFKKTILENQENVNEENLQSRRNEENQLVEVIPANNNQSSNSSSVISRGNYKSEMGDIIRQYLSVIPEKSLVQHSIQSRLIRQNQIYKNVHYAAGGLIQFAGTGGGLGVAAVGAVPMAAAISTVSVTGTSALLFGPVGWIIGGTLLIVAGIFTGIVMIKKGQSISKKVEIQNEINAAIQDVFQLYIDGKYQTLIERLSGRHHFKNGSPIIHYDRDTRDFPVRIVKSSDSNAIDTIDYLLDNGVRPDGIGFLLNIVAEVLLSKKIVTNCPAEMQQGSALQILNKLIDYQRLKEYAETLDRNHKKILDDHNGVVDGLEDTAVNGISNAFYSMINRNDNTIFSAYVKDFKEMPILNRLEEMRHTARINYAMALIMSDSDKSLKIVSSYLQEVRIYYSQSQYEGIVNEKMDIITDLMFAFGIKPNLEEEMVGEKLQESTCWRTHFEFVLTPENVRPSLFLSRIEVALSGLKNSNKQHSKIFAVLMFDKLRIGLLSEDWISVTKTIKVISDGAANREYNFDEVFNGGFATLIDIYEKWTSVNKMTHKTKKYLLKAAEKLDSKAIDDLINAINQITNSPQIQPGNHVKIENLADVLISLFNRSAMPFISLLIKPLFLALPVSSQLKEIYESKIDISNNSNVATLKTLSRKCHDSYFASLKDLIVQMAFLSDDKIEDHYRVIEEKLAHAGWLTSVHPERKKFFKESIIEIRKLNKSNFKFAGDKYLLNLLKESGQDEKKEPVDYYKRGVGRLKAFFTNDLNEYYDASSKASKQGLFGSSESTSITDALKAKVIGQTYALDIVTNKLMSLRQNKQGEKSPSFLFVGPTGVGKTELGNAISTVISANDTNKPRIVIFNMERYSNSGSVTIIVGSSLGFVGSQDEPVFIKMLKPFTEPSNDPDTYLVKNTVILFDEYDRAHKELKDSLMGLIDNSEMVFQYTLEETNYKKTYHFKDCIIVATSNLLATQIQNDFTQKLPPEKIIENFDRTMATRPHLLAPEIRGRFQLVPFGPINRGEEFQKIVEIYLNILIREYEKKYDITMSIEDVDKKLIIYAFEAKHYKDGTSIRTFKTDLKTDFESIFSKLNAKQLAENQYEAILRFNSETQQVELRFQYDNMGNLVVIDEDQNNQRFCLTSNNANLRLSV